MLREHLSVPDGEGDGNGLHPGSGQFRKITPNSIEFRADVTIHEIPPNPPDQGGKPKARRAILAIFSVELGISLFYHFRQMRDRNPVGKSYLTSNLLDGRSRK
jgi:hypothetical protein